MTVSWIILALRVLFDRLIERCRLEADIKRNLGGLGYA